MYNDIDNAIAAGYWPYNQPIPGEEEDEQDEYVPEPDDDDLG